MARIAICAEAVVNATNVLVPELAIAALVHLVKVVQTECVQVVGETEFARVALVTAKTRELTNVQENN
jgi:hypothetical protein